MHNNKHRDYLKKSDDVWKRNTRRFGSDNEDRQIQVKMKFLIKRRRDKRWMKSGVESEGEGKNTK